MKVALFMLAVCGIMACSSATAPRMHVTGTILYMSFEGGFYAIKADDGVTYDPNNLPVCYQVDGLHVDVTLRVRKDLLGYHMAGPVVDILSITAPGRICSA